MCISSSCTDDDGLAWLDTCSIDFYSYLHKNVKGQNECQ